jgi:hypothetical protein
LLRGVKLCNRLLTVPGRREEVIPAKLPKNQCRNVKARGGGRHVKNKKPKTKSVIAKQSHAAAVARRKTKNQVSQREATIAESMPGWSQL